MNELSSSNLGFSNLGFSNLGFSNLLSNLDGALEPPNAPSTL